MSDPNDDLEILSVSPQAFPAALRRNFMDTVDDKFGMSWVDPLTPRFLKMLELVVTTTPLEYNGSDHLTTISDRAYGTTSFWYVILYMNGFQHPDEIPSGTVLNIPTEDFVSRFLAEQRVDLTGELVEV